MDGNEVGKTFKPTDKIVTWFLPNPGDFFFFLVLTFLLYVVPCQVFADGSSGWHFATGRYILEHGMPTTDLISYTFPHKPWVPYEWLFDVIGAGLIKMGGGQLNLLAVFVSATCGFVMMMLYERARKEGANIILASLLVLAALVVSSIHWLARPHIFTFLGVLLYSFWLEDFWSGKLSAKSLWLRLSLVMVLWLNLHPGFQVGLVQIAIYVFCAGADWLLRLNKESASRFKTLLIGFALCSIATLFNPYGLGLHRYLVGYHSIADYADVTSEFLSPIFHGALQPDCLEILIAFLIGGIAISKKRLSMPRLLTCLAFLHLALYAVRNMPLFALLAIPATARMFSSVSLSDLGFDSEKKYWWHGIFDQLKELDAIFNKNDRMCNKHLISLICTFVLGIAAVNGGSLFGNKILTSTWDGSLPTIAIQTLGDLEKAGKLDPNRGFNSDNWGGYIRFVLDQRVFIDDRVEFYGRPFNLRYGAAYFGQSNWKQAFDGPIFDNTEVAGSSVQWLLVPRSSNVASFLARQAGWEEIPTKDKVGALLVRRESKSN